MDRFFRQEVPDYALITDKEPSAVPGIRAVLAALDIVCPGKDPGLVDWSPRSIAILINAIEYLEELLLTEGAQLIARAEHPYLYRAKVEIQAKSKKTMLRKVLRETIGTTTTVLLEDIGLGMSKHDPDAKDDMNDMDGVDLEAENRPWEPPATINGHGLPRSVEELIELCSPGQGAFHWSGNEPVELHLSPVTFSAVEQYTIKSVVQDILLDRQNQFDGIAAVVDYPGSKGYKTLCQWLYAGVFFSMRGFDVSNIQLGPQVDIGVAQRLVETMTPYRGRLQVYNDTLGVFIAENAIHREFQRFLTQLGIFVPLTQVEMKRDMHPLGLELGGQLLADLMLNGVDPTIAEEAVARFAVQFQIAVEEEVGGQGHTLRKILDAYNAVEPSMAPKLSSITEWVLWIQSWLKEHDFLIGPFSFLFSLITRVAHQVRIYALQALSIFVNLVERHMPRTMDVAEFVGIAIYTFADFLEIEHRKYPKSVWALIYRAAGTLLTSADVMLMALPEMQYEGSESYEEWATKMASYMEINKTDPMFEKIIAPPIRETFLPANTYGNECLEQYMTELQGHVVETERERTRLQNLLDSGAKQGIDSAWMASPERTHASLSRYTVPAPVISAADKERIRLAVDSMAEDYPQLFSKGRLMTVGNVMNAMKWKYSAGLPFMSVVKKRSALLASPWFMRIKRASENILMSGKHPGMALHGFPKADVIPLEKALDVYGLRTISAQDIITSIVYNVVLMERNKRPAPIEANFLNMIPRTEGGFRPFVDQVLQRDHIFSADGWRFDSTVPGDVVIETGKRTAEHLYKGQWNGKAAVSIVEAAYTALAHGYLVNVTDASVLKKGGGGGTGSVATSTDNRDWVVALMRAAYSAVTGKHPREFTRDMLMGNASDDITIACNKSHYDTIFKMQQYLRSGFGVLFNIEEMDKSQLDILHLKLIPVSEHSQEMYQSLGRPTPPYALQHDPDRLKMKRTAYRSDRASMNSDRLMDYLVARSIGHILLTPHDPDTYSDLAKQAMEDIQTKLSQWFLSVHFNVDVDQEGRVIAAKVESFGGLRRTLINRYKKRGIGVEEGERRLRQMVNSWIKANQIPSYRDVFKSWIIPIAERDRQFGVDRRYRVVDMLAAASLPVVDLARFHINRLRRALRGFGTSITRLQVESVLNPPVVRYEYTSYQLESFIYAHQIRRLGRYPTPQEFLTEARQSPFSSAIDPIGFLWKIETNSQGMKTNVDKLAKEELDRLSGIIITYTAIYLMIDWEIRFLGSIPFLRVVLEIWLLLLELAPIYAILNYVYFMGTGSSSLVISQLIPKDPYSWHKQLAASILMLVPWSWMSYAGSYRILSMLPAFTEWISRYQQAIHYPAGLVSKATLQSPAHWARIAARVREGHESWPDTKMLVKGVQAPTGSGKSTSFISELVRFKYWDEIWLLCPTRLARDNYENSFLERKEWQVVDIDRIKVDGITVKIATYGHFLASHILPTPGLKRLIILDEFHRKSTDVSMVQILVSPQERIFLSATPDLISINMEPGEMITLHIPPRFNTTVQSWDGDNILQAWERAEAFGWDMSRVLIIEPIQQKCQNIKRALEEIGVVASVLSRQDPVPQRIGCIVATAIADVAVTIEPPPTCLIDSGRAYRHNPNPVPTPYAVTTAEVVWQDMANALQRQGRVGRLSHGFVIRHTNGTSGPPPDPAVSPMQVLLRPETWEHLTPILNIVVLVDSKISDDPLLPWLDWDISLGLRNKSDDQVKWFYLMFILQSSNITWLEARAIVENVLHNDVKDEQFAQAKRAVEGSFGDIIMWPDWVILQTWLILPPLFVRYKGVKYYTWTVAYRYHNIGHVRYTVISPSSMVLTDNHVLDYLTLH